MAWLNWIKAFFGGSKKATTALVGFVTILLRDYLGLSPDIVELLVKLIMAYLGAQGIVDVALAFKGHKTS